MSNADLTTTILTRVHVVLKPPGFRKNGSIFTKECGDVRLAVSLQKSQSSTSAQVTVTVNLKVCSYPLCRALGYAPDHPLAAEGHWQQRLGFLLPMSRDLWWTARSLDQAAGVAEEIADALLWYGLPALEAVSSTEKLRALWESGRSPGISNQQRTDFLAALRDPSGWQEAQSQCLQAALERHDALRTE
jgi:hypothetical protein